MKSKKIVIVVFILLILVGGFIGYKSVKNYRSSNILLSLFNDVLVHDGDTYFINGKEVTRDKANDINRYGYIGYAKVYKYKSRNIYPRVKDSEEIYLGTRVEEVLKINKSDIYSSNYDIYLSFDQEVTCRYFPQKCIAKGNHESSISVTVHKDGKIIKLSKEDYQKTFNYMWEVLKRDYFDLLINYIARSYNYPYSYDNFGHFKNFTFCLWDSKINYKSIKLSEEKILKMVND